MAIALMWALRRGYSVFIPCQSLRWCLYSKCRNLEESALTSFFCMLCCYKLISKMSLKVCYFLISHCLGCDWSSSGSSVCSLVVWYFLSVAVTECQHTGKSRFESNLSSKLLRMLNDGWWCLWAATLMTGFYQMCIKLNQLRAFKISYIDI